MCVCVCVYVCVCIKHIYIYISETVVGEPRHKFSEVSALVYLLYKVTVGHTFENAYLADNLGRFNTGISLGPAKPP